jgi:hypothetical protein
MQSKFLDEHQESVARLAENDPSIALEVYKNSRLHAALARLKCSAKRKKIPFDLDIKKIDLPEVCPVFGFKLYFHTVSPDFDSYSFDRLDNTRGYTKNNVCIISKKANSMKSSGTLEELVQLGEWAKEQIEKAKQKCD